MASGPSDPNGSTVEAPLTINIPKGQMSKAPESSHCNVFAQGTNITVPVSVQKQSLPSVASAEALDSNGAANANLPRRKRKTWSAAEDLELIAAVQKFGEGNWANILKGDFKSDRTASQLSQVLYLSCKVSLMVQLYFICLNLISQICLCLLS